MNKTNKANSRVVSYKFSDAEIALFKSTFCENVELVKLVANAFMQTDLSPTDKDILKGTFSGKVELNRLMRKKLIAELHANTPLGLNTDIWREVKTDNLPPDMVMLDMLAKRRVLELTEEGLKIIQDPEYKPKVSMKDMVAFDELSKPEDVYVNIKARNEFMANINAQMWNILSFAGRKDETIESIKTRMLSNSTQ